MLRLLTFGLAIAASAAAAQSVPNQPNTLPEPTAQTAMPTDPASVPVAPPAFVPGLNADDTPPTARPNAIRISGGVMAGLLLSKVDPVYPAEARGKAGTVVMSARVGKDGHVINLAALSGPQVFQTPAVSAVKHWIYKPYMLNGEPIEVMTTITVNFNPR